MLLFKIPQGEMKKIKKNFEKMNLQKRYEKFIFHPLYMCPFDSHLRQRILKKILKNIMFFSPMSPLAYLNTMREMFFENSLYIPLSSWDYEGMTFPIISEGGDMLLFSEEDYEKCIIHGEMYINVNSSSSYVNMDIIPYPSPREMNYNDIAWMQACGYGANGRLWKMFNSIIEKEEFLMEEMCDIYYYKILLPALAVFKLPPPIHLLKEIKQYKKSLSDKSIKKSLGETFRESLRDSLRDSLRVALQGAFQGAFQNSPKEPLNDALEDIFEDVFGGPFGENFETFKNSLSISAITGAYEEFVEICEGNYGVKNWEIVNRKKFLSTIRNINYFREWKEFSYVFI